MMHSTGTSCSGEVAAVKAIDDRFVELVISQRVIARTSRPGQFVMVGPRSGFDPLLKRPLGIFRTDRECFSLLFEIVGRGTELLATLKPGDWLSMIGPLGKGFTENPEKAWLIAGGRGIVPLCFLAETFHARGIPFSFYFGVRHRSEMVLTRYLEGYGGCWTASCEETTPGTCSGTVLDLFERDRREKPVPSGVRVYACGPEGLYQSLRQSELLKDVPVEVSLEALMGCGSGLCLSCAVPRRDGQGYFHVCSDGPVFEISEVYP